MLRAIIVEDEELGRETLNNLLRDYCSENVQVVGLAASAEEARNLVVQHAPDLVFLDVEMPKEDGFAFLESVHPRLRNFSVVFVTAHNHYAVMAIKASAIDFLVKPVDIDELQAAVLRVMETRRDIQEKHNIKRHIESVLENINVPEKKSLRLALPDSNGYRFVACDDVIYCEAEGAYTSFFIKSGEKIIISKATKHFEDVLIQAGFLRTHRSYLINPTAVVQFIRETDSTSNSCIVMSNGDKLEVPRRKKTEILQKLKESSQGLVE